MITELILVLYFFAWYVLIVVAILFTLSGADDLFFDIYYWTRYFWRKLNFKHYPPLTYEKLKAAPEKHLAVLLPCWQEANVIGTMLTHNCYSITYEKYDIFVGVYMNDPETVEAVMRAEKNFPQVHCVVGKELGPTNKASNLNGIFRYIQEYEKEHNIVYDMFVLHDSEDIIHPLSFSLYNYLMPRKDMIQIPIFPLEVNYFYFTHWIYNDEFCENHTKDIIVREAIKGLVPSAGVGTAFSRRAIGCLIETNEGVPFQTNSLTEDYSTALLLRLKGLKQIFVSRVVLRTAWKKRFLFGTYHRVKVKEYIATRALFPLEYMKAVRQKARWIMGISIQEWIRTGWVGDFRTRYTLFHDRKAVFTHLINLFGYGLFFFWFGYYLLTHNDPNFPSLQEQLNQHTWVWLLILFSTFVMFERLLQRFIATTRVYGWIPAFLAIPRIIYANIVNFHAILRAYYLYFFSYQPKKSKSPAWDKTEHHFPGSHVLIPYKRKLGDLLVQRKIITPEELEKAIGEQQRTGERLGDILKRYQHLNQEDLIQALASQFDLPLVPFSKIQVLKRKSIPGLSWYHYLWLLNRGAKPLSYDQKTKTILVAIDDPSNEGLITQIIAHSIPYRVSFALINPYK